MSGNRYQARGNFDLPSEPNRPVPINRTPALAHFGLLPEPRKESRVFHHQRPHQPDCVDAGYIYRNDGQARDPAAPLRADGVDLPHYASAAAGEDEVASAPQGGTQAPEVKLEQPKINMPKIEPKPDLKPVQMEAKLALPTVKAAKPSDDSGSAAQGRADGRRCRPRRRRSSFHRARSPGRDIWRHSQSRTRPSRPQLPRSAIRTEGCRDRPWHPRAWWDPPASATDQSRDPMPARSAKWRRPAFRVEPALPPRLYSGGKVASAGIPQMQASRGAAARGPRR